MRLEQQPLKLLNLMQLLEDELCNTERFKDMSLTILSYFRPCIIPLEGGVASGFRKPEEEEFETRLYVCRGKRVVRMRQVVVSIHEIL
jgi:uncharacterized protein YihD (DUF1040 family)